VYLGKNADAYVRSGLRRAGAFGIFLDARNLFPLRASGKGCFSPHFLAERRRAACCAALSDLCADIARNIFARMVALIRYHGAVMRVSCVNLHRFVFSFSFFFFENLPAPVQITPFGTPTPPPPPQCRSGQRNAAIGPRNAVVSLFRRSVCASLQHFSDSSRSLARPQEGTGLCEEGKGEIVEGFRYCSLRSLASASRTPQRGSAPAKVGQVSRPGGCAELFSIVAIGLVKPGS